MGESHFGRFAKSSTARILEIFLLNPGRPFDARELAEILGWRPDTGPRIAMHILKRLHRTGWLELAGLATRVRKGKPPRTYLLNVFGYEQAQLFVAEVQAREALTAQIMQLLLGCGDNWAMVNQLNSYLQWDIGTLSMRITNLTRAGWILRDTSGGYRYYRYTINPTARNEVIAFIAMVAARSSH